MSSVIKTPRLTLMSLTSLEIDAGGAEEVVDIS